MLPGPSPVHLIFLVGVNIGYQYSRITVRTQTHVHVVKHPSCSTGGGKMQHLLHQALIKCDAGNAFLSLGHGIIDITYENHVEIRFIAELYAS